MNQVPDYRANSLLTQLAPEKEHKLTGSLQTHLKVVWQIIQDVSIVVKSLMPETLVQQKKQYVTPAKSEAITAPNVSRKNPLQTLAPLHPTSSPKSIMTHYSWTPLTLGRRICGISQSKLRETMCVSNWIQGLK